MIWWECWNFFWRWKYIWNLHNKSLLYFLLLGILISFGNILFPCCAIWWECSIFIIQTAHRTAPNSPLQFFKVEVWGAHWALTFCWRPSGLLTSSIGPWLLGEALWASWLCLLGPDFWLEDLGPLDPVLRAHQALRLCDPSKIFIIMIMWSSLACPLSPLTSEWTKLNRPIRNQNSEISTNQKPWIYMTCNAAGIAYSSKGSHQLKKKRNFVNKIHKTLTPPGGPTFMNP